MIGTPRTRTWGRVLGTVLDTVEALTQGAPMEGNTMVVDQEVGVYAGACLPVGEPVTLVIDEERFFGWVASASPVHSLACVAIEFKRGSQRVQELIPVENIQRLRDYLQAHPELRQAQAHGAPLRQG
jgi:hypothetical protein